MFIFEVLSAGQSIYMTRSESLAIEFAKDSRNLSGIDPLIFRTELDSDPINVTAYNIESFIKENLW